MTAVGTGVGQGVGGPANHRRRAPKASQPLTTTKFSSQRPQRIVGRSRPPQRVRGPYVERLMQSLSKRDWSILQSVCELRLVTGMQLERLHFTSLVGRSRSVMRWRVLKRLVDDRALVALQRRAYSARRSAAELCYALDSAGQRAVQLKANREPATLNARRPGLPGERFIEHTLAVAELAVALSERARSGTFRLASFSAEPAAWWPDGLGRWLKPDASFVLQAGDVTDYWWCEVDLATESLPTLTRKLLSYLDFLARGQRGPDGVMPRVLVAVPTDARLRAVAALTDQLPSPASRLFCACTLADAPDRLVEELNMRE